MRKSLHDALDPAASDEYRPTPQPLCDDPGSCIGDRKNPGIGSDSILTNICLESVEYLLWQENHLGFFAALAITYNDLAIFDVRRGEFQHLPDSHATTGHEFEDQPVPWILCPENDFIHDIL